MLNMLSYGTDIRRKISQPSVQELMNRQAFGNRAMVDSRAELRTLSLCGPTNGVFVSGGNSS